MDTQNLKPVNDLTFEEAVVELEEIVRQLEEGRVPLEHAMSSYARGTELRKACEEKLKAAKLKVDQIQLDAQGAPSAEPHSELTSEFSE